MKADSPEDRLLKLIKNKTRKGSAGENARPGEDMISKLGSIVINPNLLKPALVKTINRILLGVLVISLLYLILDILLARYRSLVPAENMIKEDISAGRGIPAPGQASGTAARPADYETVPEKGIFQAPPYEDDISRLSAASSSMLKRFNLVGIITGERPQAIIENAETGKTYYLYKGQSFEGVMVFDIEAKRVVLDYGGEKITLVL